MRVIICGAGDVGLSIAQYLSTSNDVILIDNSETVLKTASEQLDIKTVLGHAADPRTLEEAGADKADVIIAVTGLDETNIVTSQLASSIFNIKLKVARIRTTYKSHKLWEQYQKSYFPIDIIISPESEVVKDILENIHLPFASQVRSVADHKGYIIGLNINQVSPFLDLSLSQVEKLVAPYEVAIVRIKRDLETFIPQKGDVLKANDFVQFLIPHDTLQNFGLILNQDQKPIQRFMILGGSPIGVTLATKIKELYPEAMCTLIEYKQKAIEKLISYQETMSLFQGDALDHNILEEAGVHLADMVIAVTRDDKINILGSLLAKRYGAKYSTALVHRKSYLSLMDSLGIDRAINISAITIFLILKHLRKGDVSALHLLGQGFPEELIEVNVTDNSYILGRSITEISNPKELWIPAIVREGTFLLPKEDFIFQVRDKALIATSQQHMKKVHRYFKS